MALIPKHDLIKAAFENGDVILNDREYIGMSGLGHPCKRAQWYGFHWASHRSVSKRISRIFERGDLEEPRVTRDLGLAGVKVANEQRELIDPTGHIRGHTDGDAIGVPTAEKTLHLLEVKTMNNARFKAYVNKGLKISDPKYWGQIQVYMGEGGYDRCFYVVTNKDTEERSYKRYKYERADHEAYMAIGFEILTSEEPPKKIGEKTWFDCKFCDHKGVCHNGVTPKRSCRTCEYFDIEMEGKFKCGRCNVEISKQAQIDNCDLYELSKVLK